MGIDKTHLLHTHTQKIEIDTCTCSLFLSFVKFVFIFFIQYIKCLYRTLSGGRIRVSFARPRTRGRRRRGFDPNLSCYTCGEKGHFSRDCVEIWRQRRRNRSRCVLYGRLWKLLRDLYFRVILLICKLYTNKIC